MLSLMTTTSPGCKFGVIVLHFGRACSCCRYSVDYWCTIACYIVHLLSRDGFPENGGLWVGLQWSPNQEVPGVKAEMPSMSWLVMDVKSEN